MKIKTSCLAFALSLAVLPALAHGETAQPANSVYEGTVLGGEKTSGSATEAITKQATQVPGDIYRGTLFGAEQKKYHSDIPGKRPLATKKLVYDTSLIRAIKINDADRVRTLMFANVNVNEKNYAGITPLTIAAEKGNMDIIRLLVERGKANINDKSSYGVTPLIAAAAADKPEVVTYLLKYGADATAKDDLGKTALLYAAGLEDSKTLQHLIAADRLSINLPDNHGNTPLLYAVQKGNIVSAKALLDAGTKVDFRNPASGLSASAAASAEGDPEMIKLLIKNGKADPNLSDLAGRTPIFYAVENDKPEAVRLLLMAGADPNAQDNTGATPLMIASAKNYQDCVTLLLQQKGIDTTLKDHMGRNAVMYSTYAPDVTAVQKLIAANADINAADLTGNTPLMNAIKNGQDRMAVLLIQQGADLTPANQAGETAFSLAEQSLPNSATARVLSVKKDVLYQQAKQKESEALAEIRDLEQQIIQEEEDIKQLREDAKANAAAAINQELQEDAAILEDTANQVRESVEQTAEQTADVLQTEVQQPAVQAAETVKTTVQEKTTETKAAVQQKKQAVRKRKTTVRKTTKKTVETIQQATVQPQEINMADFLKQ